MSFGFVRPLYDDNRDVHVYNYNREYQLVVLLLEKRVSRNLVGIRI